MRAWLNRRISHRLRALLQKELNQIKRDRRIMMSLVLPPLLQLLLFGSVMNPSVSRVNLGIVDDSRSSASRDLVAALSESGSFVLKEMYPSVDALGQDISLGVIDAGIVIPPDLARDLSRGRPSTVQVLLNAMNANTAAISQGYVQSVFLDFNAKRQASVQPEVRRTVSRNGTAQLHPALLYNPGGVSTWFIVTGLLGTLLIMNGTITASTTMVKERAAGTLEQLLMTPASMTEIIVAKIVPPFLLLAVPASIALFVIRFYFNVPFHGSAVLIAVASALCLLCGIGIGTAVATITKSAQQAQLATFFITPPLSSLSGAMSPAEAMPDWLRPFTALNPVYHFGIVTRAALIKGAGIDDLWPHLAALCAIALVLVSVSVWRFRQQLN